MMKINHGLRSKGMKKKKLFHKGNSSELKVNRIDIHWFSLYLNCVPLSLIYRLVRLISFTNLYCWFFTYWSSSLLCQLIFVYKNCDLILCTLMMSHCRGRKVSTSRTTTFKPRHGLPEGGFVAPSSSLSLSFPSNNFSFCWSSKCMNYFSCG